MANKKRIRNLIKKKYKPFKILKKSSTYWSDTIIDWKKIMSDFAIKAEFFGSEAEKASRQYINSVLGDYRCIPESLVKPERPLFAMERIRYGVKEAEDYYSRINMFPGGIMEHLKEEAVTQVSRMQNAALKQYLRKNLEIIGYSFYTEAEFLDFAKGRITRISFPGNMYRFEYYLDYGSRYGDKEILIGISNNKIEWAIEPNRVTVTVG